MTFDEDQMREEIEGFIKAELESSTFTGSVIELVWETLFKDVELTDEEDAAATKMYDIIFNMCLGKMLKALDN